MDPDISSQRRSYRRGLVLGLTMGEIVILIIFALLLAFSVIIEDKQKEIDELTKGNKPSPEVKGQYPPIIPKPNDSGGHETQGEIPNDFDELGPREPKNTVSPQNPKLLEEKKEKPGESIEDPSALSNVEPHPQEAQAVNEKGTEMPACWVSSETGKVEYIFDVALTSNGIILRDNALPHRKKEQRKLPLAKITFKQELNIRQFLRMTNPLFNWSVNHGCRFFVKAFDLTKANEKAVYKRHLRYLGHRFYHFVVDVKKEDLKLKRNSFLMSGILNENR